MLVVLLKEIESYTFATRNVKLSNTRVTELAAYYISKLNTLRTVCLFFDELFCFERQ